MTDSPTTYKRLPMKGVHAVLVRVTGRLYLGADHLVYLETRSYTERTRRFYFRDIQMITYAENSLWLLFGAIYALIALFFGILAALFGFFWTFSYGEEAFFAVFFGILALVPAIAALGKFVGGPSCRCYLHTAVQEIELIAVRKVRHARRFIALVRPLIEAAQTELAGGVPESGPGVPPVVIMPSNFAQARRVAPPAATVEKPPLKPHAHAVAFLLLLALGLSYLANVYFGNDRKTGIEMLVMFLTAIALAVALAGQQRARCPKDLYWYTWLAMGILALGHVWAAGFAVIIAMEDPDFFAQGGNAMATLREAPAFQAYIVALGILFAGLSLLALTRLLRGVYVAPAQTGATAEMPHE